MCFRSEDTNEDLFVASPDFDLKNAPEFKKMIDCGTNEELFLALAALRDDTDINQWFVCNDDYDTYDLGADSEHKKGEFLFNYLDNINICLDSCHWHKATPEELIKHFK